MLFCAQDLGVILSINPNYWNSTQQFPCGPSKLVDEPVCDYELHGLQVRVVARCFGHSCKSVWTQSQPHTANLMHSPI
jgi:hypothetical protein